jgi:molybdopterin biosynthesis enzyme
VEYAPLDAGVDPSKLAVDITSSNAVFVTVGGVMPHGANCIVPMGSLSEIRTLCDMDQRPESIKIKGNWCEGDNVRAIGSDIEENQEILPAGHVINPASIGLMAR